MSETTSPTPIADPSTFKMMSPRGSTSAPTKFVYALVPTSLRIVPTGNWERAPLPVGSLYCIPTITNLQPNTTQAKENICRNSNEQRKGIEVCRNKQKGATNKHVAEEEREIEVYKSRSHIKYEIHTTVDEIQTNEAIFFEEKARGTGHLIMVKYSIQEEHNYACRNHVTESESETTQISKKNTIKEKTTWYTCDSCNFKTRMRDSLQFHLQSNIHKDVVSATQEKENEIEVTENQVSREEFHVESERHKDVIFATQEKEKLIIESIDSEAVEVKIEVTEDVLQKEENEEVVENRLQSHFNQEHNFALEKDIEEEETTPQGEDWTEVTVKEEMCEYQSDDKTESEDETVAKFKCPHCKYKTDWKNNMTKHVISKHTPSEKIRWLHCAHCSYKAKVRENLVKHWKNTHNKSESLKWNYCDKCSYKSQYGSLLKNHSITAHMELEKIKWWACDECPFRGKLKSQLTWHVKTKHQPVWFSCEKCHYKSADRSLLVGHFKTHDKIRRCFRCKECPYQEYSLRTMEDHVRSLHGMKELDFKFVELSYSPKVPTLYKRSACFDRVSDDVVKCTFCRFTSNTSIKIEGHIMESHNLVTLA